MRNIYGNEIKPFKWQKEAARLSHGRNLLVSAPTGSGKTVVAYLSMEDNWNRFQKIVFTAPTKALSNERYKELRAMYPGQVGILTGDIKDYESETHKILCCTQEILLNEKVEDSLVIIDEIHYLFQNKDRALAYLEYLYEAPESNRYLMLSATISREGISLLERVAKFQFTVFFESKRPVDLEFVADELHYDEIFSYDSAIIFAFSYKSVRRIARTLSEISKNSIDRSVIREFVRNYGVKNHFLENMLSRGIGVYHGGLLIKEKLMTEDMFRQKIIRILVGTNALALGVNLPAELVVFTQLEMYGGRLISSSEFYQMSGRAGRPGLYPKGFVGISDFKVESYNSLLSDSYRKLRKKPVSESLKQMPFNLEKIFSLAECRDGIIRLPKEALDQQIRFLKTVFPENDEKAIRTGVENIFAALNGFAAKNGLTVEKTLNLFSQYYFNEFDFYRNAGHILRLYRNHSNLLEDVFGLDLDDTDDEEIDGCLISDLLQIRKYISGKIRGIKALDAIWMIEKFVRRVDKNYLEI